MNLSDPKRPHLEGRTASHLLEKAIAVYAEHLNCESNQIQIFPNFNIAAQRVVSGSLAASRENKKIVAHSAIEKDVIKNAAIYYADAVAEVLVDSEGLVIDSSLETALKSRPSLVAVQHANSEIGTVQEIAKIQQFASEYGASLLVDASASFTRIPLPKTLDAVLVDAADFTGVQGVCILKTDKRFRHLAAWPEEGHPWFGGQINVPAVYASAAALIDVLSDQQEVEKRQREIIGYLQVEIPLRIPNVQIIQPSKNSLPHVLTISCLYLSAELLSQRLDSAGYAVGSGSACTTQTLEPSHVLAAIGAVTHGNIRISLSPEATVERAKEFVSVLSETVTKLRQE